MLVYRFFMCIFVLNVYFCIINFCIYLNILVGFYFVLSIYLLGDGYYIKEMIYNMMENIFGYLFMYDIIFNVQYMNVNKELGSDGFQILMFYMVLYRKFLIFVENIKFELFDVFLSNFILF